MCIESGIRDAMTRWTENIHNSEESKQREGVELSECMCTRCTAVPGWHTRVFRFFDFRFRDIGDEVDMPDNRSRFIPLAIRFIR